jgi:hypothetical protein
MPGAAVARRRHDGVGERRRVSAGTHGAIEAAVTKRQVTRGAEGHPDHPVWLVIKRPVGESPSSWDERRHAPVRTG